MSAPFPCPLTGRSNPRPTKATELLPGDVDVVAAIGDSLMAAMGALARTIISIFTEYRGVSFSGGAQSVFDSFVTVPAILRLYNPNLRGFAVGNGNANSANAGLNVAVSGARSYDLPGQINNLETKMRNLPVGANEWKLISIFVGGNDLCDYCQDTDTNSPTNFRANLEVALDLIKARFRNVFVNLLTPPDVTLLGEVTTGFCGILHGFECPCSDDSGTSQAHRAYTNALISLAASAKYRDPARPDFHVSLQPFFSELQLPLDSNGRPDISYFAPDCFHFSGKAHEAAAVALWNNMCEDTSKRKSWIPGEPVECPDRYLA